MSKNQFHTAMAGSGKPYAVLTEQRLLILQYLHYGKSLSTIAARLQLEETTLQHELKPLIDAHLVTLQNQNYQPTFVIIDAAEIQRVEQHAQQIGKALGDYLLTQWADLEKAYARLTISQNHSLKKLAFLLIGDRILDIELLNALAMDGTLMPPAPARPSPDTPEARYYFWMVEGHWDYLGKYGQNSIVLPYDNWYLLTFGRYKINDAPNAMRQAFEAQAQASFEQSSSPETLAKSLNSPIFYPVDAELWTSYAQQYAQLLLNIYKAHENSLRELFASLRTSTYLPNHFSEFFCWYNHLAYAIAIDRLIESDVMVLPENDFMAVLWHEGNSSTFHGA